MASSRSKTYDYRSVVISLENCIIPKEKLEKTPSVVDGLNIEIETDLRIVGCEYIQTAGILLKLAQVAMATGQVLFQRFYYSKSFVRHDVEVYAMACLFLAAKIEECPRRIRDVINVFHHIKQRRNLSWNLFQTEFKQTFQNVFCTSLEGSWEYMYNTYNSPMSFLKLLLTFEKTTGNWDWMMATHSSGLKLYGATLKCLYDAKNQLKTQEKAKNFRPIVPMEYLGNTYFTLKNLVIKAERRILKELGFCVHVQHPHKVVITFLQVLDCEKNQPLAQLAWNFMNDALRTNVFVRYQPGTIACACIFLSARQLKIPLPSRPPWWGLFDGKSEDIEDVCRTLLQLYQRPKVSLQTLNKAVDRLKKILPTKKTNETFSTDTTDDKSKKRSSESTFSQPGSPSNVSPITEGTKSRSEDVKKNGSNKRESQGSKGTKKSSKSQQTRKDNKNPKPSSRSRSPLSEKSDSASATESDPGDSSDSDSASADSGSSNDDSRKRKEKITRRSRGQVDDRQREKHDDIRSTTGRKLYKSKSDTNSYRRARDRSRSPYRRSRSRSRSRDRRDPRDKPGRREDRNGDYKITDKYEKRDRSGRR